MRTYLSNCRECFLVTIALARVLFALLKLAADINKAASITTPEATDTLAQPQS